MPNSQKDPFFKERQMLNEERRKLQIEQLKALIEANNQKGSKQRPKSVDELDDDDINNIEIEPRKMESRNTQAASDRYHSNKSSNNATKQESIMNLLQNHNLRNKPIYEEEDEDDHRYNRTKTNTQRRLKQSRQQDDYNTGKNSNMGFVPFMRTDEFLDPAHATSPCPPSRESTATKRDRDKARQVSF